MKAKHWFSLLSVALILALLAGFTTAQEPAAAPLGTSFIYQGQLKSGGAPYTGACDLRFTLYDDANDGSQIGPTQTRTGVSLTDGYLTVELDFGTGAFQGDARWLGIEVCCPTGACTYTPLTPRQPLMASPYALALPGLWTQPNATSPNLIGGYNGNWVTSGAYGATIGGGGYAGMLNRVTDIYGTVGGGADNQAGDGDGDPISIQFATVGGGGANSASNFNATVGGGYGNAASAPSATVGGGWYNTAENIAAVASGGMFNHAAGSFAAVGGGELNSAAGPHTTVGGGQGNAAGGDWAVIGGGQSNIASGFEATVGGGYSNDATGSHSTVAGGELNTASGYESTVGGGEENTAGDSFATVAGGGYNSAGAGAAIAGGYHNTASGLEASVGGGEYNTAGGSYAAVPGGAYNLAQGLYSFAAGRRAKANNDGSFVWADSTDADFADSGANTFNVRAANGTKLFADNGGSGLVVDNDAHSTNGDAMDVFANVSKGDYWAAAYLQNMGTSPAIYAEGGGTYAAYFFGQIYTTGCVGCLLIQTGLNDGAAALQPGDLAAVSGLAEPLAGSSQPILRVHRAVAGEAVVGVVQARGVRSQSTRNGRTLESIDRAEGDVQPGDYLFLVVYGPAQVKADASAGAIAVGARLTAAARSGYARALQTRTLDGMAVAEAAPSVGIALGTLDSGTGLIPIFVTLH